VNPVPEHAGPSATSRAGGALAGSAATTHTLGVPWEKDVEAAYFRNIPDEALVQSAAKPFSVPDRGRLLVEIGAVLSLLPEPPGRILDLGCGTGWTSSFLARSGYDVVGVDLSPEAVDTARAAFPLPSLAFAIHDFDEPLPQSFGLFDAVVFFDTLHHAEDERRPLRAAYLALRDGGVCVACEPGTGHAVSEGSIHAVATFGGRERAMPPPQVVAAGREAGSTDQPAGDVAEAGAGETPWAQPAGAGAGETPWAQPAGTGSDARWAATDHDRVDQVGLPNPRVPYDALRVGDPSMN